MAVLDNTPANPSKALVLNIQVVSPNTVSYQYKFGSETSTICADPNGYSANKAATVTISENLTSFPDGPLLLCVVAEDGSGLRQAYQAATSYSWFKDSSPPAVETANLEDGGTTFLTTESPLITWTLPESDWGSSLIDYFEICLSQSGATCDLVPWTNVGLLSLHKFTNLNLLPGNTYYVLLRATDTLGQTSNGAISKGFRLYKTTDLTTADLLWETYGEGSYPENGGSLMTSRGGESTRYDGVFHNHNGSFYVSQAVSYNFGRVSSDPRWVFYIENRGNNLSKYELWSFDSLLNKKYFLGATESYYTFAFDDINKYVYFSKKESLTSYGIWRVHFDGTSNEKIVSLGNSSLSDNVIQLSPDQQKLVYLSAKASPLGQRELYVANVNGTGEQKIIAAASIAGSIHSFRLAASKIIVVGDLVTLGVGELWSFNWDGSGRTKLSGTLPTNGDVWTIDLNAAGTKVYYQAEQTTDAIYEVWRVNPDGTARAKINGTMVAGGYSYLAQCGGISPSNEVVSYKADQDIDNVTEVFFVPIGGSTAVKMHPSLAIGGSVACFPPRKNSPRLITRVKQSPSSNYAIYSINANGTDLRQINPNLADDETINSILRSHVNDWVFYTVYNNTSKVTKIFRVDSDGQNHREIPIGNMSPSLEEITDDDQRLIIEDYSSENGGGNQLSIDANTGSILPGGFYPSDADGSFYNLSFSSNAPIILFKSNCTLKNLSPSPQIDLFPWKVSNGCVQGYHISEGNHNTVALGDLETVGLKELFLSRNSTAIYKEKINATTPSSIANYAISANGNHLIYVADSLQGGLKELWYVNLSSNTLAPQKLNGSIPSDAFFYKMTVRDQGDFAHILGKLGTSYKELYRINLSNGAQERVGPAVIKNATENHYSYYYINPTYSKLILIGEFTTPGVSELRMADATLTSTINIAESFEPNILATPVFSPDGLKVLMNMGSQSANDPYFVFDLNSGTYQNLIANEANTSNLIALSWEWIDSNSILTSANFSDYTSQDLYKINLDGSPKYRLTPKLTEGQHITDFHSFPSIHKITYLANTDSLTTYELFEVDYVSQKRKKISIPLADGESISAVRYFDSKNIVVYKVIKRDLSQPHWYIYRFDTNTNRVLFTDLDSAGKIIGDVVFNDNFDFGVFSVFQSGVFTLFSASF